MRAILGSHRPVRSSERLYGCGSGLTKPESLNRKRPSRAWKRGWPGSKILLMFWSKCPPVNDVYRAKGARAFKRWGVGIAGAVMARARPPAPHTGSTIVQNLNKLVPGSDELVVPFQVRQVLRDFLPAPKSCLEIAQTGAPATVSVRKVLYRDRKRPREPLAYARLIDVACQVGSANPYRAETAQPSPRA